MDVQALFDTFTRKRILVIGDVMVDAYLAGTVSRISPEAPVPIIHLTESDDRLGGAANVALNLLALGCEPILCSAIGQDEGGERFMKLLDKRGLNKEGIERSSELKTTVKTRIIGNKQQLVRVDDERVDSLPDTVADRFIQNIEELISRGVDAVILEDYNKGLLTPHVIQEVIRIANENNVIIAVDPKKENFFEYRNVTLFKPNLKELQEGLNIHFDFATQRNKFEEAVLELERRISNAFSFITLSEHGVFIKGRELAGKYLPAHIRNISDVSGAGDTVISVATLCMASGLTPEETAGIANLAGGLVCERRGVVPVEKEQLMEEVTKLYGS